MVIKFITALAWLWGSFSFLSVAIQFVPPIKRQDGERAVYHMIWGFPAWAWLIARYWL